MNEDIKCEDCKYYELGCQCETYMAAGCIPTKRMDRYEEIQERKLRELIEFMEDRK